MAVPMALGVFWTFPLMVGVAAKQGPEVVGGWKVFAVFGIQVVFFAMFNMASGAFFSFSLVFPTTCIPDSCSFHTHRLHIHLRFLLRPLSQLNRSGERHRSSRSINRPYDRPRIRQHTLLDHPEEHL